jgi:hypothetical protein
VSCRVSVFSLVFSWLAWLYLSWQISLSCCDLWALMKTWLVAKGLGHAYRTEGRYRPAGVVQYNLVWLVGHYCCHGAWVELGARHNAFVWLTGCKWSPSPCHVSSHPALAAGKVLVLVWGCRTRGGSRCRDLDSCMHRGDENFAFSPCWSLSCRKVWMVTGHHLHVLVWYALGFIIHDDSSIRIQMKDSYGYGWICVMDP